MRYEQTISKPGRWGRRLTGVGTVVLAALLGMPDAAFARSPQAGGFESVQPCTLEQYVAPSSESELRVLKDNLDEDVRLAFQAGEKELVLSLLCQAAAAKIAAAEVRLGAVLAEGWGFFTKDEERARYWLKRASDRGDMVGAYMLSVLYRTGRGGPVMGSEGMRLLRAAATEGNSDAQFELAVEYMQGEFVPADLDRARQWASLSAKAGNKDAIQMLALLDSAPQRR